MRAFCHHVGRGILWFRVFGYGLVFKWVPACWQGESFSERNRLVPMLKAGPLIVRPLQPYSKEKPDDTKPPG